MFAVSDWQAEQRERDEKRRAEVMAFPVLPVRRHNVIIVHDAADVLAATSIGPNGEAIALWTSPKGLAALTATTTQPGWASFPDPRASRPVAARVTVHRAGPETSVTIADLPLAHPTVQVLPDDRVLVVAARCRWRPDGPDRNAIIYDTDGRLVAEGTIGDGVEHALVSRSGHIWVGYFDEGVYGNYGWGDAGAPPPLGAPGLVRLSPDLEPDWRYPTDVESLGAISDCYVLNIDGDTAWACYYTDFPVVRIQAGTVTGWRNTIAQGARALAVADTNIALYGGYGPYRDVLVIASRGQDQLHKLAEYCLVLPDGSPLPATVQAIGRGADLHLINEGDWYRLDLDDLPAR
jgi:hypothetical protein